MNFKRTGFTLIELIISMSVFSVLALVSLNSYFDSFQNAEKTYLQNEMRAIAHNIMKTLSGEIAQAQIDYEEYFSQCVLKGRCPTEENLAVIEEDITSFYGQNHGYYSWQFVHGGFIDNEQTVPDGFGELCQTAEGIARIPNEDCLTDGLRFSRDVATGSNPATLGLEFDDLNALRTQSAFCANESVNLFDTDLENRRGIQTIMSQRPCGHSINLFNELYLIDPATNRKIILGKGKMGREDNYGLMKIELNPLAPELQELLSYPVGAFSCAEGYTCLKSTDKVTTTPDQIESLTTHLPTRNSLYREATISNLYSEFMLISQLKVNVEKLEFIIDPIEDPILGFKEENRAQPKVTILLEITPSKVYKLPFLSNQFKVRLQKTVTTRSLIREND